MSVNLELLARIARGERSFRAPPLPEPEAQEQFHQLVADVRQLAVAGYILAIRRSGEWAMSDQAALDITAPGITPAGLAALRQAGYEVPGLADRPRGDRTDG